MNVSMQVKIRLTCLLSRKLQPNEFSIYSRYFGIFAKIRILFELILPFAPFLIHFFDERYRKVVDMKLFFIFVIGSSIRDEVTCLDMGGTGQKNSYFYSGSSCFDFYLLYLQHLRHLTRRPVVDD